MTKEKFESILTESSDLKSLSNSKLIENMDVLSTEFDETKTNIINMTVYLDKLEELNNKTLLEYESRNDGK
jgi:hypothetical protein